MYFFISEPTHIDSINVSTEIIQTESAENGISEIAMEQLKVLIVLDSFVPQSLAQVFTSFSVSLSNNVNNPLIY